MFANGEWAEKKTKDEANSAWRKEAQMLMVIRKEVYVVVAMKFSA